MPFEKFEEFSARRFEKREIERWFDQQKEQIKQIFSNLYEKIFPEIRFNIRFLNSDAFLKICREKNLPLPPWKAPEGVSIQRIIEKDYMQYLINENALLETIENEIGRKKEEKNWEKIAENWLVGFIAHEI